jgi:hypothetical protein
MSGQSRHTSRSLLNRHGPRMKSSNSERRGKCRPTARLRHSALREKRQSQAMIG